MTASAFIAAVQAAGGRVYWEGAGPKVWAPTGALGAEMRAAWPGIKPAVVAFVAAAQEAQRRWDTYVAGNTTPAPCSGCGTRIPRWPWENPAAVLCLECARALEERDA